MGSSPKIEAHVRQLVKQPWPLLASERIVVIFQGLRLAAPGLKGLLHQLPDMSPETYRPVALRDPDAGVPPSAEMAAEVSDFALVSEVEDPG